MGNIIGIKPLTFSEYANIPNGTRVFNHGADECVAAVNLLNEGVYGNPFIPINSAKELWTERRNLPQIKNNYTFSRKPKKGSIAVWKPNAYNEWHGHTGAVTHVHADGSFNTREQNYYPGGNRWLQKYTRSVDDTLYGFLTPKKRNEQTTTTESKGNVKMGSYSALQKVTATAQWKTLAINDKGDVSIKLGAFNGNASANVFVKGVPGDQVQIAISKEEYKDGKTVKSTRLRTVSGVVPPRGIVKLQVSANAILKSKAERLRIKIVNDSKNTVEVSYVGWDILEGK